MVTIRVLIMLLAMALPGGYETTARQRLTPRREFATPPTRSANSTAPIVDWQVCTALAQPTITPDGAVWWVTADDPPRLKCDRGDRVESFPLDPGQVPTQNLWYLAVDTKGRIWLFSNPSSSRTAFFDHGTWRTFGTLEEAYGAVAREEKDNPGFRIGNPRQHFYPVFAGDGRVAYRALDRVAQFDGTRWDQRSERAYHDRTDGPPFYVDGVLTARTNGLYVQFRGGHWGFVSQAFDYPYEEVAEPPREPPPPPGVLERPRSQTFRFKDNAGTTWTGKVPDLYRALGDIEVRFPTARSPLSVEDRICDIIADASGRTWFVLAGDRWLTGTGDYGRLALCTPRQSPPEIEWERKPPESVDSGSVTASVRVRNVSGEPIVRYRCGDDAWRILAPKGSSCEIPLGYPVNGTYTLRVQAFDELLRPSGLLTHTFEVRRNYDVEVGALVDLLGSQDLDEREMAARALVKIGKPTVPVLTEAAKTADRDRLWWIQAVLDEIAQSETVRENPEPQSVPGGRIPRRR